MSIGSMINNTKAFLATMCGVPMLLRNNTALDTSTDVVLAKAGPKGGLCVESVDTPTGANPITKSDTTDTTLLTTKGVIVGTTGSLVVRDVDHPTVTVTIAVTAGQHVPLQCSRIMAATDVTDIVGLS